MGRELIATIGTVDHAVEIEAAGEGRFVATIDGRRLEVDAVEVRPRTWSLVVAGRAVVVDLDRDGAVTTATTPGGPLRFELEDARRRRLAQAVKRPKPSGEELRAPIAGRVVKLLVAAGEPVAAGQGVVVLEAMKMENELRAERGGTVQRIAVEPGQSVETRALLVVLT